MREATIIVCTSLHRLFVRGRAVWWYTKLYTQYGTRSMVHTLWYSMVHGAKGCNSWLGFGLAIGLPKVFTPPGGSELAQLRQVGGALIPMVEFRALKAISGGLKLAYRLMNADLHQRVRILYTCTNSCWSWYASQVETVESPEHGLKRSILLSGDWWMQQSHIQLMINNSARFEQLEIYANLRRG